jgi:hypothetical protein
VELPYGDTDGPLVVGQLLKAVDLEVEEFSDPYPRSSRQEKTQRHQGADRSELPPDRLVALLGKRLGKVPVRRQ